jgi:hypothetical protein
MSGTHTPGLKDRANLRQQHRCFQCGNYLWDDACGPTHAARLAEEIAAVNAHAALQQRVAEAERERDLAVAHDRQPYPTAAAYELVCAARDKWQARAETAEQRVAGLEEAVRHAHRAFTNLSAAYGLVPDGLLEELSAALTGSATGTAMGAMREAVDITVVDGGDYGWYATFTLGGETLRTDGYVREEYANKAGEKVRAALALADGGAGGGGEGSGT